MPDDNAPYMIIPPPLCMNFILCDKPAKQALKSGHKDKHLINCIDNDNRHKEFALLLPLLLHLLSLLRLAYACAYFMLPPTSPIDIFYGLFCYIAERLT